MESARARFGKAMRSMVKRQKTTGVVTGALSAIGTVAAFGAGQAKKAETAWKEYEAGYGEVPGADVADIKKPGLFKRTMQQFLPGGKTGLPEGDVRIGDTLYDRSKLQKAGSFLGSEASAILDEGAREQYLKRVAPGKLAPGLGRAPATEPHIYNLSGDSPKRPSIVDEYDVDEEFGYDAWTAESPVYQQGEEPGLSTVGQDWQTPPPLEQKPEEKPQGMYSGWLDETKKTVQGMGQAGFGRWGDNAMKVIDGEPAHINKEIEGDMSPEDIKKYGSGTINPITGKKEYFLGAIATGLAIGSSLYKGYQATQNKGDIEAGRAAAGGIQQEQLDLVGSKYTTGMQELDLGTTMKATDIQTSGQGTISKQNLATSTVANQMQTQMENVLKSYKTDAQKIQDIKKMGTISAEDAYQATLTGLESQPTGFLEGMFS